MAAWLIKELWFCHGEQKPQQQQQEAEEEPEGSLSRRDYRFIFPEFLPDPKAEWRNEVRERLERRDLVNRREQIEIPGNY